MLDKIFSFKSLLLLVAFVGKPDLNKHKEHLEGLSDNFSLMLLVRSA